MIAAIARGDSICLDKAVLPLLARTPHTSPWQAHEANLPAKGRTKRFLRGKLCNVGPVIGVPQLRHASVMVVCQALFQGFRAFTSFAIEHEMETAIWLPKFSQSACESSYQRFWRQMQKMQKASLILKHVFFKRTQKMSRRVSNKKNPASATTAAASENTSK